MKNLQKLTKVELINKVKDLKSTKTVDNSNKTTVAPTSKIGFLKTFIKYIYETLKLLGAIKELFFHLTLISFVLKFMKRFPILKTIIKRFYRWIFSIFGFAIVTQSGFIDIFYELSNNIIYYFYNFTSWIKSTWIYHYLFGNRVEEDDENEEISVPSVDFFVNSSKESKDNPMAEEISTYSNYIYYSIAFVTIGLITWFWWDEIIEWFSRGDRPGNPPDTDFQRNINELTNAERSRTFKERFHQDIINQINKNPAKVFTGTEIPPEKLNKAAESIFKDSTETFKDAFEREMLMKVKLNIYGYLMRISQRSIHWI